MVKRLVVGLLLGAIVGSVIAALLMQGLGITSFDVAPLGAAFAYLAAAVTGVLTGLIAGKPIWSADGKIEAGLKAFFGALLAVGGMFVLRQWVNVEVPPVIKGMAGPIGHVPASLPLLAAILGGFFELDNTGGDSDEKVESKGGPARANAKNKVRVGAEDAAEAADDEEIASARRRRN